MQRAAPQQSLELEEYLAGDVSLYRYVGNMSIRLLDPMGEDFLDCFADCVADNDPTNVALKATILATVQPIPKTMVAGVARTVGAKDVANPARRSRIAGDVNLYRYVFNRLPIARDPFGYAVWVEAPGVYAGLHQRVCVDVPDDCDAASCDEKGKPYCITFSNDRGGGGCSPNSRSSGSSSDSSERSSRAACSCLSQGGTADDATFDSVFGATLPKKFQKSPRGSGIIGPDNGGSDKTRPSTGSDSATKDFLKNLSGEQDCEVFKYFKNLENTRGEYRLLWFPYTCRHFSQDIYAIIDNRY